MSLKVIAHIESVYKEKFGTPRQSGLTEHVYSRVIMEKEYDFPDAFKGIEEFSYLWLLWLFDEKEPDTFRATVRPPKLGGNERRGVFATRSPFRPNGIGLSSVKLEEVLCENGRIVLLVSGADLIDGTRIIDIKPYLEYADSHPLSGSGFAEASKDCHLEVILESDIADSVGMVKEDRCALEEILSLDPRPGYHDDENRLYGMHYKNYNVSFQVKGQQLLVVGIEIVNEGQ